MSGTQEDDSPKSVLSTLCRAWSVRVPWAAAFVICLMCSAALAQRVAPDAQSRYLPTGPPPTDGYQPYDEALKERVLESQAQKVISGVPSYMWRHGCGPTAAGMVIGYWDGHGASRLIPGDASTQTYDVDQAIATGDYADTHYADYSLPMDYSPGPLLADKSEPPSGDEHPSDSLADFMKTSWSAADNYYGWSWFSDVDNSLRGYVAYANAEYGASYVPTSYNQNWGTFTWEKFVVEINADRPMVFLVDTDGNGSTDHFVPAIGYRDSGSYQEYACFDTWTVGRVRWEQFRHMGSGRPWGIYGATYFDLSGTEPPDPQPGGPDKNRYISMVIPDTAVDVTAIRVSLTSLHRPPAPELYPDFTAWEGEFRWVNSIAPFHICPDSPASGTTFRCAVLGCDPEYRDWGDDLNGATLHVTGAAVVPSSHYDVVQLDAICQGDEDGCTAVSAELRIATELFGNVDDDPMLNVLDSAEVVDHLKGVEGAPSKPRVQMRPNLPDAMGANVTVLDAATVVDALKDRPYGFAGDFGPCTDACPGEAACP